jgi:exonuclease SbcC
LSIENFGSYKKLELDLTKQGLTLIHGATGSGKSTVLDAIYWTLYGQSGKDTNADAVRSWTNANGATVGRLELERHDGVLFWIHRQRGGKADNDLFFHGVDGVSIRGKDLIDTQRLLSERLGVDCDGFVGACYYHEFSSTSSFFSAKAKERREIFEQLADLSFPERLGSRCLDIKRELRKDYDEVGGRLQEMAGRKTSLVNTVSQLRQRSESWGAIVSRDIRTIVQKAQDFEQEKEAKIKEVEAKHKAWAESHRVKLSKEIGVLARLKSDVEKAPDYEALIKGLKSGATCATCGALSERITCELIQYEKAALSLENKKQTIEASEEWIREMKATPNPVSLAEAHNLENFYYAQLAEKRTAKNPYEEPLATTEQDLAAVEIELKTEEERKADLMRELSSLNTIFDLTATLRGALLTTTVKQIEQRTNHYLEEYFDGELRVLFEATDDDIEISVFKSSYPCSYKQLSKGQRQLLRLCFWLASRESRTNQLGQTFNVLLLDEPTDGLHPELKVKAVRLFEKLALEHETVFVVEHSTEAKACFSRSYKATIENDVSRLELE